MIQLRTVLTPADNSGAKKLMVFGVSHKIGKYASLGDVVNCVVHGADPNGVVANIYALMTTPVLSLISKVFPEVQES